MSILASMIRGGIVFSLVSVAAFAVWALGEKWFFSQGLSEQVMSALHSAGYFSAAHICSTSLHSVSSELTRGLLYGLGFCAGIGYAFALMRQSWKAKIT